MERTRLFIKNLPKHLTDERFRQHFESKGLVTDAKILRTKDGESRKIGFIGFKDEKAAATAQKFFNKTFIDTSRIIVEIALPKGDKHLPRPWSKYSEGSSRFEQKAKNQIKEEKKQRKREEKKKTKADIKEIQDDAKAPPVLKQNQEQQKKKKSSQAREMEEFASLMKKRSATKLWANDEAAAATQRGQRRGGGKKEDEGGEEQEVSSSSSDEEDDAQEKKVPRSSTNEQEGKTDNIEDQEESGSNGKEDEVEEEEADSVVLNKAVSDMDYLRSKMSSSTKVNAESDSNSSEDDGKGEKIAEESDDSDEEEGKGGGGGADSSDEDSSSHHQLGPGDDRDKNRKGRASKTAKQGDTAGEAGEESGADGEEEGSGDEEAVDSDRLFVRNLPFSVGEEELRALFGAHGEVADLHRPLDEARRPRGFAFVRFLLPEAARRARAALDRRPFQGRLLHVLPAQRLALGDDEGEAAAAAGQSSYKARREAERRAKAGDRTGWSAAHVRGDAVVGAVARRLGLARGQVLGPDAEGGEGESLAVRLAVGETHVLQENRDYFLKEGVDLTALESAKAQGPAAGQRSRTALLVKNLPHTTEKEDLSQLFERFGTLGRLLLPPSRTVALVEFVEATEARKAFKSLAYKRFQHVPLYLEWAPIKAIGKKPKKPGPTTEMQQEENTEEEAGKIDSSNRSSSDNVKDVAESMLPKEDEGEASTLYVKNLNFNTTEENLKKAFQGFADFRAVSIPRKKKGNKILSMGYGFVEFASKTGMETAMKEMQNYKLEGHALQLKPSSAKKSSGHPENAPKSDEQSTKIMVRNLAFQATAKEVRALFSEFGELKKVRLPKKFDGNNRGFAFVEFLTAKEARAAFSALASTHLYGRHLVLEWAQEDAGVEELRGKAARAAGLMSGGDGSGGARKKRKADAIFEDLF